MVLSDVLVAQVNTTGLVEFRVTLADGSHVENSPFHVFAQPGELSLMTSITNISNTSIITAGQVRSLF